METQMKAREVRPAERLPNGDLLAPGHKRVGPDDDCFVLVQERASTWDMEATYVPMGLYRGGLFDWTDDTVTVEADYGPQAVCVRDYDDGRDGEWDELAPGRPGYDLRLAHEEALLACEEQLLAALWARAGRGVAALYDAA